MGADVPTPTDEIRVALRRRPPEIPSKHLYDDVGSALFERITRLPEYYQTRTEEAILETHAREIARVHSWRELVELGSGAGRKVRMLLDALLREGTLERLVLLEINRTFLEASAGVLGRRYPGLVVEGVVGDFEKDLARLGRGGGRLVLLLAGTIGNLAPREARRFLRRLRRQLAAGDGFLVGFDLVKDPARLVAAYDDAEGVTAAFNRNVLRVVNARFGADFDPEAFRHVALWDAEHRWIEMRLRATRAMRVRVEEAGVTLDLARGDDIRTEISAKYTRGHATSLAEGAGYRLDRWFTDPEGLFALGLLRAAG